MAAAAFFVREILTTLALTNATAAKQILFDGQYSANLTLANQDNVECFSLNEAFRCTQYAGSAAGILALMAPGGTDPSALTPDQARTFQDDETHEGMPVWQRSNNWLEITNNVDLSGRHGYYIINGQPDIAAFSPIRLLTPQYLHAAVLQNVDLGTGQMCLAPVGVTPPDSDWIDVPEMAATKKPLHVVAASDTPYPPGTYALLFRAKPGTSATVIHDALILSPTRITPS